MDNNEIINELSAEELEQFLSGSFSLLELL
jgi:hypothetical protein